MYNVRIVYSKEFIPYNMRIVEVKLNNVNSGSEFMSHRLS